MKERVRLGYEKAFSMKNGLKKERKGRGILKSI